MAYVNTQQTDSGGSRAYIKTTKEGNSDIVSLTGGFDNFSNYYNTLIEKFGKDGFIKDIEYAGTKYSYLSNRKNLISKNDGGWNSYGSRGRQGTYYYKLPSNGLSVPNCTAWAYARILEIMIATGLCYTKDSEKIPGKTYYTAQSQAPAQGADPSKAQYSLDLVRSFLDCGDGRQFYDRWPGCNDSSQFPSSEKRNKWRAFGWNVSSTTPRAGCVVAWRGISNTSSWWVPNNTGSASWESGFPGHVAVVEKVLNAGTENESIIVSESNYSGGGTAWDYLVKMYEIKKNNSTGRPYGLYNLACLGFGYTPACDLLQGGVPGSPVTTVVKKEQGQPWTEEQEKELEDWSQRVKDGNGGVEPAPTVVGEKVKITLVYGYKDKEGTKKVNQSYAGRICQIIKVHDDKYTYNVEVGVIEDNKPITWGFYRPEDLIKPEETQPVDEEENN